MTVSRDEMENLIKDAERGDTSAQVKLGRCYLYGRGVAKDSHKAAALFQKAAASGSIDAEVGLGILHSTGRGLPKDHEKSLKYWNNAVAKGNTWGLITLAINHSKRATAADYRRAFQLLSQAVTDESGDLDMRIEAAELLAVWYGKGKGVPKSAEKQFEYFAKAAQLGSVSAKACLGEFYWLGLGVGKDLKLGYEYNLAAAEGGNVNAANFLGRLYEWGDGFPANFSKAAEMYDLAAKNGSLTAQFKGVALEATINSGESKTSSLSALLLDLDATELTAQECYDAAYAADVNGDGGQAIKYFQICRTARGFDQLGATIRRDLKRIEYFRTEAMNDYFLVLASSTTLKRFQTDRLKLLIPGGTDGYCQESRELILRAVNAWINVLPNGIRVQEVQDEAISDLRFAPIDKDLFFGTAVARTCYVGNAKKELLTSANQSLIQLPKRALASRDDRTNFSNVCLHEIGHALGLSGHSIFAKDVMFGMISHLDHLSERDVSAINALYADNAEYRIAAILESEAKRNNPYALGRLGLHHYVNKREGEAIEYLERASTLGDEYAQFLLGLICWRKLNFKHAADLLEQAASGGIPNAMLYRNCLFGLGAKMDKDSIAAIQTSAGHGDLSALVALGMLYTFGNDDLKQDTARGAALLKQAVEQGSTFAKFVLAINALVSSSQKLLGHKAGSNS